jgi:hypothetical protein
MVAAFERTIALDTARNETELRPRVLALLATGEDLGTINQRVYDEIFLTPRSDPWLGLMPADGYSGLDGNGVHSTAPR